MSTKQDIKTIVGGSVSVPMSAAATTIEVTADAVGYAESAVKSTPAVVKALVQAPFAAAKGYLMEAEGLSAEEAEKRAYKYARQDLSRTIAEAAEGSGKLLAELMKEEEAADSKAN